MKYPILSLNINIRTMHIFIYVFLFVFYVPKYILYLLMYDTLHHSCIKYTFYLIPLLDKKLLL